MAKPAKMPAGYYGWSLIDGERGITTLKDALHNLSPDENGDHHEYSRGVLVGAVSAFMACGMTYDDACQLCWQAAPPKIHRDRVPESWRGEFGGKVTGV